MPNYLLAYRAPNDYTPVSRVALRSFKRVARVARDADVVIAFLDADDAQHNAGVSALGGHLAAGDEIVMCATTYAEVIVRPLQRGTDATVDQFLAAIAVRMVDVDRALARSAAELCARNPRLRLPDALALATARRTDAKLLTLDQDLQRVSAREAQDS
jgi:predicted nucleic acid-binding protein